MTEKVKALNERGIEEFRKFIAGRASDPTLSLPVALLTTKEYLESPDFSVEVEDKSFATRLEMAEYLHPKLSSIGGIEQMKGVWSWLALFYFDLLCPPMNRAMREYRYIPDYDNQLRYYRHLLLAPYIIYRTHGENGRIFLCNPPSKSGDVVEQFISNQKIFSNKPLIEVLDRLYYSAKKKHYKRGTQGKKTPGNIRRIPAIVDQFALTYDLADMTAEDILNLLPKEFDNWKHLE